MAATRLSDSQKQELVARFRDGEASAALAEAFGCSANTVSRVVRTALDPKDYEALKQQRGRSAGQAATAAGESSPELPLAPAGSGAEDPGASALDLAETPYPFALSDPERSAASTPGSSLGAQECEDLHNGRGPKYRRRGAAGVGKRSPGGSLGVQEREDLYRGRGPKYRGGGVAEAAVGHYRRIIKNLERKVSPSEKKVGRGPKYRGGGAAEAGKSPPGIYPGVQVQENEDTNGVGYESDHYEYDVDEDYEGEGRFRGFDF